MSSTPNASENHSADRTNTGHRIRVWDLPTRLFHWSLVFCLACLIITGYRGGDAMPWHFRFGYAVATLLLFRLVWGFVGGQWSRFASFVRPPKTILSYLRGDSRPEHHVGHNPLGALSVLALLVLLALQVASGLFSYDDIAFSGPFAKFVEDSTVSWVTGYHKEVNKLILIALIVMHIVAIGFYKVKKKNNLIPAMLHGDKLLDSAVPSSRDDLQTRLAALLVFVVCAGLVAWTVS